MHDRRGVGGDRNGPIKLIAFPLPGTLDAASNTKVVACCRCQITDRFWNQLYAVITDRIPCLLNAEYGFL